MQHRQLIDTPTRVTQLSATLLDVILSTVYERRTKAGVIECGLSDHHSVFIIMSHENIKAKTVHVRDYKHFNEIKFMFDLRCAMFEQNRRQDTLDKSCGNFKESFMAISNKHGPIKSHTVRVNPWVNRDIINMMYE